MDKVTLEFDEEQLKTIMSMTVSFIIDLTDPSTFNEENEQKFLSRVNEVHEIFLKGWRKMHGN